MSANAEQILKEILELDAHISRLLVQAKDLQERMKEVKERSKTQE